MNKDNIETEIKVNEQIINVLWIDGREDSSLTDLAHYADEDDPRFPIQNWMKNKDVISYLGLWKSINNEKFKGVEFDSFKNEAGSNKFKISPQKWIKKQMQSVLFQNLVNMKVERLQEAILHLNLQVGYFQSLN